MSMRVKGDGKPRCRDEWHAGFGREGAGYVPPQGRMTRCALTSPVLSSTISPTQNQWDYLAVLVDAIRRYGTPEALVTDGGSQFYSNMALELYELLRYPQGTHRSGRAVGKLRRDLVIRYLELPLMVE